MDLPSERQLIVAGVDGSDPSLNAVRWAAVEAASRRAALRLVTVSGHWFGYGPRLVSRDSVYFTSASFCGLIMACT
jgi:nucleotide-binding universal stress UspA family protein